MCKPGFNNKVSADGEVPESTTDGVGSLDGIVSRTLVTFLSIIYSCTHLSIVIYTYLAMSTTHSPSTTTSVCVLFVLSL